MKCCNRCGIEKPTDSFFPERAAKDGLQGWCIRCKNAMAVEYNARRRHKIRAWEREHAPTCVDCGEPTSFNGKRRATRCDPCRKEHDRQRVLERINAMQALREEGLLNHQIADQLCVPASTVAKYLSRPYCKRYGLPYISSPYFHGERAAV